MNLTTARAFVYLGLALMLTACRQALVPIPTDTVQPVAPTATPDESAMVEPEPTRNILMPGAYAVVWIENGEPLVIRQPAGITSMAVDTLASDQRGLSITGRSTQLGSSTWVEINLPEGGKGWVNAWNLTEDVTRGDFCADPRAQD